MNKSADGVSDGGSLRVEGVATNAADETSHISYAVLDKNGETITTITRKFVVTQAVSFIFDSASTTDDGAVVVVKRSTDPVRINNSSFSLETAGIAAGAYRLVSDKTVAIQAGRYFDTSIGAYRQYFGLTPSEHCRQRNDAPSGNAYVFDGQIRKSISDEYGDFYVYAQINPNNDWRNVPLPLSMDSLIEFIAQEVLHECCHSMGLVPSASAAEGAHNDCTDGCHYMDDGGSKLPLMRLGFDLWHIQRWMPENTNYLRFVFPQTY